MKKVITFIFLLSFIMILFYCGCSTGQNGNGNEPPPQENNPIPTLTSISPNSKVSHLPAFILTVNGSNFVSGAKIVFSSTEMDTTFVSSTELTCQVEPDDISLPADSLGSNAYGNNISEILSANVLVLARNPSPDGGDSNSIDFSILNNHQFSTPVNISSDFPEICCNLDMAVETDGTVNACWIKYVHPSQELVYMKRSTDGGNTWGTALKVTYCANHYVTDITLSVNSVGDLFHTHTRGSDGHVYFKRSTNSGQSWETPKKISSADYGLYMDGSPSDVAIDDVGNINVIFNLFEAGLRPGNIYFTRSTNNGSTWNTPLLISVPNYGTDPHITVDRNGNINAVWFKRKVDTAKTKRYVHFRRSTNNGITWSNGINVNQNKPGYYHGLAMAVDKSGNIYLMWAWRANYFSGNYQIYFSCSKDNGVTWSEPINFSADSLNNTSPDITVDVAGNINVVWTQSGEIYFRRSVNSGTSWSNKINVSNTSGGSGVPVIGVDSNGNIKIAWRAFTAGPFMVYFCRSTE